MTDQQRPEDEGAPRPAEVTEEARGAEEAVPAAQAQASSVEPAETWVSEEEMFEKPAAAQAVAPASEEAMFEKSAAAQAEMQPSEESAPGPADRRKAPRGSRPSLEEERDPVVREEAGYRLRLEPRDLVRLRELPGAKGKSDRELGEQFFDGQAQRLAASMVDDVGTPADVRVVVDPYSRQAFLAVGRTIRGIVSF